MRVLLATFILLISGCASPPASVEEAPILEDETPVLESIRVDVTSGVGPWHDPQRDVIEAYDLATQPVAHPCSWNDNEAYFNNMPLGSGVLSDPIPNGTNTVIVTFDWEPTATLLPSLVLGYRPAGTDQVYETGHILRGQETQFTVRASPEEGHWSFWACVSNEDDAPFIDADGPRWFWGDLSWDIDVVYEVEVEGNATAEA